MGENEQSGLESFFDITAARGIFSSDRDALGWESLKERVTNNIDRAKLKTAISHTEPGSGYNDTVGNYEVPKCITSEDCGSNFTCVNGSCVAYTTSSPSAGGGTLSTAGTTASGACVMPPSTDCDTQGCPKPPGCSNDKPERNCKVNGREDCCGGNYYRCPGQECGQCEPCVEPDKKCTQYCTIFYDTVGEAASTACRGLTCGVCADCVNTGDYQEGTAFPNRCEYKDRGDIDAPCSCFQDNTGCEECEVCNRTNGECEPDPECMVECNCFVTCPCGVRLEGSHKQPYHQSGPVCPSACREKLYQQCDRYCPPQPNPCTANPNDKCEQDCFCETYHLDCDQDPPPCPDGWQCTQIGEQIVADENGYCVDPIPQANGPDIPGGKYVFRRLCKIDPECDDCDCHCENDCGDCEFCNSHGNCQFDAACLDACAVGEAKCGGACCPTETHECLPQDCITFTDACHGVYVHTCGPPDSVFTLKHNADIAAADAVCGRFHTHCTIYVNGAGTVLQHLDCQAGLPAPTRGSSYQCVPK